MGGDTWHKMLEKYGVRQEKNLYGVKKMGIVRTTCLIAAAGKVTHLFPKVKVDGHTREALDALK